MIFFIESLLRKSSYGNVVWLIGCEDDSSVCKPKHLVRMTAVEPGPLLMSHLERKHLWVREADRCREGLMEQKQGKRDRNRRQSWAHVYFFCMRVVLRILHRVENMVKCFISTMAYAAYKHLRLLYCWGKPSRQARKVYKHYAACLRSLKPHCLLAKLSMGKGKILKILSSGYRIAMYVFFKGPG